MASELLDRRDIDFQLHTWLKVGELVDRETVGAIVDLSEKLAAEQFLPHFKRGDTEEPRLENGQVRVCPAAREALAQYAELGLFAAGFPAERGGLGLPSLVCAASYAYFAAANADTAAYPLLTVASARLLAAFGSPAQFETFGKAELEGRWLGTMCLSEPQAGSSLADVPTRAVPDGNDALAKFSATLEKVTVDTIEAGGMTKDLSLLVGPDQPWLSTTGFLDAIDGRLKQAMA